MTTVMTVSWLQLHILTLSTWDLGVSKQPTIIKILARGLTRKPDRDICSKMHSHGHQWHPQDCNRRLIPHLAPRNSFLELWQSHTMMSSLAPVAQLVTQMRSCKCGLRASPSNSTTNLFYFNTCVTHLLLFCTMTNKCTIECFLLGNSPASEFCMPTFCNTLSDPSS